MNENRKNKKRKMRRKEGKQMSNFINALTMNFSNLRFFVRVIRKRVSYSNSHRILMKIPTSVRNCIHSLTKQVVRVHLANTMKSMNEKE